MLTLGGWFIVKLFYGGQGDNLKVGGWVGGGPALLPSCTDCFAAVCVVVWVAWQVYLKTRFERVRSVKPRSVSQSVSEWI